MFHTQNLSVSSSANISGISPAKVSQVILSKYKSYYENYQWLSNFMHLYCQINHYFWSLQEFTKVSHLEAQVNTLKVFFFFIKVKYIPTLTCCLKLPRILHTLVTPSKHIAFNRAFPNIFITWEYSSDRAKKKNKTKQTNQKNL